VSFLLLIWLVNHLQRCRVLFPSIAITTP